MKKQTEGKKAYKSTGLNTIKNVMMVRLWTLPSAVKRQRSLICEKVYKQHQEKARKHDILLKSFINLHIFMD